jgi:23S rRNA pseudouridine955/2504/2580 synthase
MSAVAQIAVTSDEADIRLDRWFKRHYPELTHGRLEKLLRTGQVRVDGGRVAGNLRLAVGQIIRVPPMTPPPVREEVEKKRPPRIDPKLIQELEDSLLFKDDDVLVLNKPPGLAVQGGTGTEIHIDALLDALRFGSHDRPRLVHRLDKDTSGVLLLARSARSAAALTSAFKHRDAKKTYWAVVVGLPKPHEGKIDAPLGKLPGRMGEKMAVDPEDGKRAVTTYRVLDAAARHVSLLELEPLTGRTHQLRVHCALLGTPILGDGKYGGKEAFLAGDGVSRKLHLHARRIIIPHPNGGEIDVTAPLPPHMAKSLAFFDFSVDGK